MTSFKYLSIFLVTTAICSSQHDGFNYHSTDIENRNFGPKDWDQVQCHDVGDCPGWPTNWEDFNAFIPYDGTENMCRECSPRSAENCTHHMQSPIPLHTHATQSRQCHDRHRMNYVKGNCRIDGYRFEILPHVLRAYQPTHCGEAANIDFSMGYPRPWLLEFTDISVPSQHTINGQKFDAEVVLSHTYSVNNDERLIGNVAIMLQKGEESDHYDFLELFIQQWTEEAQFTLEDCLTRRFVGSTELSIMRTERLAYVEHVANTTTANMTTEKPNLPFFKRQFQPYDWYMKANTEYYFRYEGSMPEPPCFEGVHWRVLKNPVKVSPRQMTLVERLLSNRIDPSSCAYNSAGAPRDSKGVTVDVNRPLQTTTPDHKLVFCECDDWESSFESDIAWCKLPMTERGVLDFAPGQ